MSDETAGPAGADRRGQDVRAPDWFHRNLATAPEVGTTAVDGAAINWLRWGDGGSPPLVLVHGGGANARWWAPLAPFLAGHWQVIAIDLSGMGDSDWRPQGYRTEGWADEVLTVAHSLGGGRAPALVGHSLGGSVVAVAAARRPEMVAGVVICDTAASRSRRTGRDGRHFRNRITYPSAEEAISRFKLIPRQDCANTWMIDYIARHSVRPVGAGGPDDPTRPATGTETAWAWKFDWRLFARTYEQPFADYLGQLATTGVPVGCLFGEQSRLVNVEVAALLAELLRSDLAAWVPQAHHHLMLDQPLAFVAALRAMLSALAAARRPR